MGDKCLNDIKYLENVYDYQTAYNIVNQIAGTQIFGMKKIKCSKDLNIGVIKDDKKLEIFVWDKGKQIFGRGYLISKSNNKKKRIIKKLSSFFNFLCR